MRAPSKLFADERIVAAAVAHPLRRRTVVMPRKAHTRNLDHVDQLVSINQLIAAEVKGRLDATPHDLLRPLNAVGHVGEAAGLLTVALDLNLVAARGTASATSLQSTAALSCTPAIRAELA